MLSHTYTVGFERGHLNESLTLDLTFQPLNADGPSLSKKLTIFVNIFSLTHKDVIRLFSK